VLLALEEAKEAGDGQGITTPEELDLPEAAALGIAQALAGFGEAEEGLRSQSLLEDKACWIG
jgi:hypothetical protein